MPSPRSAARYNLIGLVLVLLALGAVGAKRLSTGKQPYLNDDPNKVLGDPKAKVFILEFSDLECPACADMHPVLEKLLAEFPGQLRIDFRHFPLKTHDWAIPAAEAASCAAEQGKFGQFISILYARQNDWAGEKGPQDLFQLYTEEAGVELKAFNACLESDKYLKPIQDEKDMGRRMLVAGTPTLLLNGKRILRKWDYEYLRDQVKAEIAKAEGK